MPTNFNDRLVSWRNAIDEQTIRQAEKAARLPIVAGHVALMPDAHVGIGATVGSVIPTKNAVIPVGPGDRARLLRRRGSLRCRGSARTSPVARVPPHYYSAFVRGNAQR